MDFISILSILLIGILTIPLLLARRGFGCRSRAIQPVLASPRLVAKWLLLVILTAAAPTSAEAKSKPDPLSYSVKWTVPATPVSDEWRPLKSAGPLFALQMRPEGLFVSNTDIALERDKAKIPAGTEFLLAESTKLVVCSVSSAGSFGYSNKYQICLVDSDGDTLLDSYFRHGVSSAGYLRIKGKAKKLRGQISPVELKPVSPDEFSSIPIFHYSILAWDCEGDRASGTYSCAKISGRGFIFSHENTAELRAMTPFEFLDNRFKLRVAGESTFLARNFEGSVEEFLPLEYPFFGGTIVVQEDPSGGYRYRLVGPFADDGFDLR